MDDDFFDDAIVGMVHLAALPGSPEYAGSREGVRERALADARALDAGGVDAIMVENFGDAPFFPDDVPKHTVAEMTASVAAVVDSVDVPVGVNVLRNDAMAALSVAAAAGAEMVRVNVHTGARVTDQGIVEGDAHETIRLRERLDADVRVFADVDVKHSAALAERPVEEEVAELAERGLADGLVVSGPGTGESVDSGQLAAVTSAATDLDEPVPVLVGSGTTRETVRDLLDVADGAIVGTALKEGGVTTNRVDEARVRALVDAKDSEN